MPPTQRSPDRRTWPANLREQDGYFSYENPLDGRHYGLGRDRAKAFAEARAANNYVAQQRGQASLLDRMQGRDDSLDNWLTEYDAILVERKLAPRTMKFARYWIGVAREKLGKDSIGGIDTRRISDTFAAWTDKGQLTAARKWRAFLFDVFREAEAKGRIKLGANPVAPTKVAAPEVKRSRLTLDQFKVILEKSAGLFRNAMLLALVTGQRREDLTRMGFRDVLQGWLWVDQGKTGSKVKIPLTLRCEAVGLTVGDVVRMCRDDVVSPFLLHHTTHQGYTSPGDSVHPDFLTYAFADLREGLTWPTGKTPATFHEIRSLSERVYRAQGVDVQALLGHRDPRTTAKYDDGRGDVWVEVTQDSRRDSAGAS